MSDTIPDLHPPSSRRRGIMLCYPFEEKRLLKWNIPGVIIQPKEDGLRCRAIITPKSVTLYSSEAHEIISVPHINEELLSQNILADGSFELDGELYIHGVPLNDLQSITSRKTQLHFGWNQMEYHIFDLVSSKPQMDRLSILNLLVTPSDHIKIVPSKACPANADSIMYHLRQFSAEGHEGIIVRHPHAAYERKRSLYIMKYKPKQWDTYIICGWSEQVDIYGTVKPDTLGRFICAGSEVTNPQLIGTYPAKANPPEGYFAVGSGLTDKERRDYWRDRESLAFRMVVVEYQTISSRGKVPRHGVYKAIVEE